MIHSVSGSFSFMGVMARMNPMNKKIAPNSSLIYKAFAIPNRLNAPPNAGNNPPVAIIILPNTRCNRTRFLKKIHEEYTAPPTRKSVP